MHCPICGYEINANTISCERCGASRITQRTPMGVLVGWLGMLLGICMGMMWLFLLALVVFGHDLNGFPWLVIFLGSAVSAGLLFYSKSTVRSNWLR